VVFDEDAKGPTGARLPVAQPAAVTERNRADWVPAASIPNKPKNDLDAPWTWHR
jgi:hypothetical protein